MRERSHGARDSKNRDKMKDPVKMDGFERQEFPQVRESGKEKSHKMFDEKKQYDPKAYEKNDAYKSKGDDSKTLKQDSTRKPGETKPKTDIDKPYDGIDNKKYPPVKDQGKPFTKPKDIDDIDYMFADDKKSTVKDAGKDLNVFGDAKTDGKKDTAKPKPDEKKPDIKKVDEKKVDEKKPDIKNVDEKKVDEKKVDEKKPDIKKPDEKKVDIKKANDDPFGFGDEDDDSDIFNDTKKKIPMKNDEKPKADTKPKEIKSVEQSKPKETKPVEQPKIIETKPVEQPKPKETKPVEQPKLIETKPVEQPKPKETKPVEQPKIIETKPVEQPKPKEAVVMKKKDSFDFDDDEF
jgi:hypothetical protein